MIPPEPDSKSFQMWQLICARFFLPYGFKAMGGYFDLGTLHTASIPARPNCWQSLLGLQAVGYLLLYNSFVKTRIFGRDQEPSRDKGTDYRRLLVIQQVF